MQKNHGHTLPELMICLLLVSSLASIATPSFSALLLNNQKAQQTNILLGVLHYARNTAVLSKETVTVCAGTTQCSPSDIWSGSLLVFIDRNGDGIRDKDEPLLRQATLDDSHSWKWLNFRKRPHLIYERNGTTQALNGTFTLCRTGKALHQVVISLSGRIRSQEPDDQGTSCR
ncbi:MAG: GspH/FimT family pseudopilin [Pseudomonas sp.]